MIGWVGRQCGIFMPGCIDEMIAARKDGGGDIPDSEQILISASEEGKRTIAASLRSNDPDKVIDTINKVYTNENLNKMGFVSAMFYCSRAVLKDASDAIRGPCANLLV